MLRTPGILTAMIVFLNGTTSSGKSSLARALLPLLDAPWFYLPVDAINSMRYQCELEPDQLAEVLERTVLGFHRAVAGIAAAGNDVLVDHVLRERAWLLDCLELFAPFDTVLVGVYCPLPELERREQERGDRIPGRAAHHFPRVHDGLEYDVECDTSRSDPTTCAAQVVEYLRGGSSAPHAADRLRERYLT